MIKIPKKEIPMFGDRVQIDENTEVISPFAKEEQDNDELDAMELDSIGVLKMYIKEFQEKNPTKKVFYNGNLTNGAFEFYLERCEDENELEYIREDKITEKQREMLAKKKGMEWTPKEDELAITPLLRKKTLEEQSKEITENLNQDVKEFIKTLVNDSQQLLTERDNYREDNDQLRVELMECKEYLRFLYRFMGHLDFCNTKELINNLETKSFKDMVVIDKKDLLEGIETYNYKMTEKEEQTLVEINDIIRGMK